MVKIQIGDLTYRYVSSAHNVGILPPSRNKHVATIAVVKGISTEQFVRGYNARKPDGFLTAQDVADYIMKNRLK